MGALVWPAAWRDGYHAAPSVVWNIQDEPGLKVEQRAHTDTVIFGKQILLIVLLLIFTVINLI